MLLDQFIDSDLAGRCQTFVADRGLDSDKIRKKLHERDILTVIDTRNLWQEDNLHPNQLKVPTRPLDANVYDTILRTECGKFHMGYNIKINFHVQLSSHNPIRFASVPIVFGNSNIKFVLIKSAINLARDFRIGRIYYLSNFGIDLNRKLIMHALRWCSKFSCLKSTGDDTQVF